MTKTVTRLLVCGGRDYSDSGYLFNVLDCAADRADEIYRPISVVIHGGASGVDALADDWARHRGIPRETFLAQWTLHGRAAGPRRNAQMLLEGRPDLCIAFTGGRGTDDMVERCERAGVTVLRVRGGRSAI